MQTKPRLQLKYEKEVVPALMAKFGLKNAMAVPKVTKVVLNVGLKQGIKDPKFVDAAERTLTKIGGQKPVKTLAKKSISNFKIRQGMVVGMMLTLRGRRMYDFLDKLINLTLPRVRDFRGIPSKSIDHRGNISVGFREFIAFPEIRPEDTDVIHGLEIAVVTTAGVKDRGLALLKELGLPLTDEKRK
jgi:large subunit ribosomal protein L5